MAIIGVNFTKISVEKKSPVKGKVNISNNVLIKDVVEKDIAPGKNIDQKGVQFIFSFVSKYEPGVAEINLEGDVLYLGSKNDAEEIVKSWKKDKKVAKEIMASVLNAALAKGIIQALILSQQVNLPSPVPLPKVKTQ